MVRDAVNFKLFYFCRGYPMKFCCFSVVLILCKITFVFTRYCYSAQMLLATFYINYKKVFESDKTGDNAKNTKNAVIQGKYKKYSIFIKDTDVSKNCEGQYHVFLDCFKLHKVLNVCTKFQVFDILP